MTITAIECESAVETAAPVISHTTKVITAISRTDGTNTPETLSAILAIGAFEDAASLTVLIILENTVSSPIASALILTAPERFIVAPVTLSPTDLSTGMLSPVIADSSAEQVPSIISPSTAKLSPALVKITSPILISETGTVFSSPLIKRVAVFGAKLIRRFNSAVVLPFE